VYSSSSRYYLPNAVLESVVFQLMLYFQREALIVYVGFLYSGLSADMFSTILFSLFKILTLI